MLESRVGLRRAFLASNLSAPGEPALSVSGVSVPESGVLDSKLGRVHAYRAHMETLPGGGRISSARTR